ncbi:MAG: PQQ-like beta-propeller repeat protein, partial [Gemmataceae bacterium]|nr:PQQ-like beta-propeller repeat protein [Gemmataceae bacterium]
PEKGPKLLWTYKNAGLGFSSFAIVGDRLYTLGGWDEGDYVLAIDLKTQTELWKTKLGPLFTFANWGDGSRSTPTIDGDRLYALGGEGDLVCLDIANKGTEVWRKHLVKDFKGQLMISQDQSWGFSESPVVEGKLVIVTPGGDDGTIVALNKGAGDLVWRSKELKQQAPYSTGFVADIHGVRQFIQTSYISDERGGTMSGIALADGKLLWNMPITTSSSYALASTPLVQGNQVYVTSGYGAGCRLFEIGKDQKATEIYPKNIQKTVKNTHGGVVMINGHIFGHSEGLGWICQNFKTGKVIWDERAAFECSSGSITAADGLLYLYTDEGQVVLAEPSLKEFTELGSFEIPEKSKLRKTRPTSRFAQVWTHPVVANGRLYLRDQELIFCYDLKRN